MTWHCESCGTTLAYAGQPLTCNPGMMKCPRCYKWMERVTDDTTGGSGGGR